MNATVVEEICRHLATVPASGDLLAAARQHANALLPLATPTEISHAAEAAVAHTTGLGPLHVYFNDPAVNEIIVNNGGDVWVERNGSLQRTGRLNAEITPRILERIIQPLGRRLDRLTPIVDARLPDGSRVCAVIPPVAIDGACFSVRRFAIARRPLEHFGDTDTCATVRAIVAAGCNVVISGATSSGKTSLLNAIASNFPAGERIITLEDTAELQLDADHVLRLETRSATADGVAAVTMTELLRASLRLRPDRLVLGEVRGPEVVDLVQALNTGHDGSFATCHANSAADALRRLEAMMMQYAPTWPLAAIRSQLHSSLDVIIHLQRTATGDRRITEIVELGDGDEDAGIRPLAAPHLLTRCRIQR